MAINSIIGSGISISLTDVVKGGAVYEYAKAAFGLKTGFYIGITRFVQFVMLPLTVIYFL